MRLSKELLETLFELRGGELHPKDNSRVFSTDSNGYKTVSIQGRAYKVHRIVYKMVHGKVPEMLDHIDGNPSNNNISNLRPCSHSSNGYNRKINTNNTSGVKNVCWSKHHNKWKVDVQVNKKRYCFGYYKDLELAELVATEARNKYHGRFARHE